MEDDLDRQDMIRDIINKRLAFLSEDFYKTEVKKQKKDPRFRMKFEDLLQALSDRVRTMKAQGVSSKKEDSAKLAPLDGNDNNNKGNGNNNMWKRKAESPPKQGQNKKTSTVRCFLCNASHPLERCNKLLNLGLEKTMEILRKDGRCYRCLEKPTPYHIAKFCTSEGFKCANTDCGYNHPTILCGL